MMTKKELRPYDIAHVGLKEGVHHLEWTVKNDFLEMMGYDGPEMEGLKVNVKLEFDKKVNFFLLQFDIDGSATVPCDRCGDPVQIKLWDEYKLVIKMVERVEDYENEDDVVYISRHDSIINVAEYIYEFMLLSIPLQVVHETDKEGKTLCNPEALALLEQLSKEEPPQKENIWKGLDAFRNKEEKN